MVWFLESHGRRFEASVPIRPWYPQKSGLCFADIVRAARSAIASVDIPDLANGSSNFTVTTPSANSSEKLAA